VSYCQHPSIRKKCLKATDPKDKKPDGKKQRRKQLRKRTLNIGTWNVQGWLGKGQEVINETDKIKMYIVAVTETKKGDRIER
jgi:hypothetical protein